MQPESSDKLATTCQITVMCTAHINQWICLLKEKSNRKNALLLAVQTTKNRPHYKDNSTSYETHKGPRNTHDDDSNHPLHELTFGFVVHRQSVTLLLSICVLTFRKHFRDEPEIATQVIKLKT